MTTTTTLREKARQSVIDSAAECAGNQHRRNFHRLSIRRDGTVTWSEFINPTDDLIDREARGFMPLPSVARVGTGGYTCNCDYCGDTNYESIEDAIFDAVNDGDDLPNVEADMLARFDDIIPVGFFEDEEDPA